MKKYEEMQNELNNLKTLTPTANATIQETMLIPSREERMSVKVSLKVTTDSICTNFHLANGYNLSLQDGDVHDLYALMNQYMKEAERPRDIMQEWEQMTRELPVSLLENAGTYVQMLSEKAKGWVRCPKKK